MTKRTRTTVSIRSTTLDAVHNLQRDIEVLTGFRPTTMAIIERCISEGAENLRKRPALAVDTAPRKGDR